MRLPAFKKLVLKDVLAYNGLGHLSEKPEVLLKALEHHQITLAPPDHLSAADVISELGKDEPRIVLLPERFAISKEESDRLIKSLEGLVKLDSKAVLRKCTRTGVAPERLTRWYLQDNRIRPEMLIQQAMLEARADLNHPPAGGYWMNGNGELSAWTWTRAVIAAEMKVMHQQNAFQGNVLDKKFYGDNGRVKVASRSEADKAYEFSLFRMPLGRRGDLRPYSGWVNMKHNSPDPDTSYRGGQHNKFKAPVIFWSAPAIFGVFLAMEFAPHEESHRIFRANPFPIPTLPMMEFIDNIRLKTLQLTWEEGKPRLQPTSMTEQDRLIGAKTISAPYHWNWVHHGKHNLSYLYQQKRN